MYRRLNEGSEQALCEARKLWDYRRGSRIVKVLACWEEDNVSTFFSLRPSIRLSLLVSGSVNRSRENTRSHLSAIEKSVGDFCASLRLNIIGEMVVLDKT